VTLKFNDVKMQSVGNQIQTVLNVKGRGAKDKVILISEDLANVISVWGVVCGGQGRVLLAYLLSKYLSYYGIAA